MPSVVDFQLHGLVTIRLVDPPAAAAASVERQLGIRGGPPTGDADLLVRFVDSVERRGHLRLIGLDDLGFTDDSFVVLRRTAAGTVLATVPLDTLGRGGEITCDQSIRDVPMLVPLMNLILLDKGIVPLHASAFTFRGEGIVAAGWRKSGKTETLLGFMAHGAVAVADEWCYVTGDRSIHGIPEPVRLQDWHLAQLPHVKEAVRRPARSRLRVLGAVDAVGASARTGRARNVPGAHALGRALRPIADRRHVDVDPATLFGADAWSGHGRLDRAFLLLNGTSPEVRVGAITGEELADRMVFAHQHHRLGVIGAHMAQRFAFPHRLSAVIDRAEDRERALLRAALSGVPAFVVEHPYPVPIEATFDAMRPHCG